MHQPSSPPPVQQPYFLPPPAVEEPAHTAQGPKPKKRWNPILGAYVTQVGAYSKQSRRAMIVNISPAGLSLRQCWRDKLG